MNSAVLLASWSVKAAIVLGAAWLGHFTLRRSSAATRYFVWIAVFAAVLFLPVLSLVSPRWEVPLAQTAAVAPGPADALDSGATEVRPAPRPATRPSTASWPVWIWMAGTLAMLARLGAGYWRVRSLSGVVEEVRDPAWRELLSEISRRLRLRRAVMLRFAPAADVPVTCGLFRASVLLPAAATVWSEDRRRIVLQHELVHVARHDLLWSFLAQLAVAAHWFNPLAWLAAAQLGREQERSCDDAVVRLGTSSATYAEHLVDVARSIALPGLSLPGPALRMADRHDLEQRVEALLERGRKRHPAGPAFRAAVLAMLALLFLPLAVIQAQRSAPPASLTGSVYDISGAVVPRALVLLHNVDGSNEESTRAGAAGVYRFKDVPAGSYDIEVKAPGFSVYRKQAVALSATAPQTLDFTVPMGTVSESMEVIGTAPAPAPAPTPAGAPRRIRVGGNVQATKLIKRVNPAYPPSALAAGIEGTVLLRAVISMNGDLLGLVAMSKGTDPALVEAAQNAVSQWRYQPTLLNGQPVEIVTTISVTFRLASESH